MERRLFVALLEIIIRFTKIKLLSIEFGMLSQKNKHYFASHTNRLPLLNLTGNTISSIHHSFGGL